MYSRSSYRFRAGSGAGVRRADHGGDFVRNPVPPLSVSGGMPPPSASQTLDGDPRHNDDHRACATFCDVVLIRGGQPVEDAIKLRMSNPSRDVRGAVLTLEYAGDGLYAAVGAEIDRAGLGGRHSQVEGQQIAYA
ncbi:MAG: hypothetical protein U0670_15810 [Anaerolineae bacterium]